MKFDTVKFEKYLKSQGVGFRTYDCRRDSPSPLQIFEIKDFIANSSRVDSQNGDTSVVRAAANLRAFFDYAVNPFIYGDREQVRRLNDANTANLSCDSRLAILIHGLTLDGRTFFKLRQELLEDRIRSVALEYDDRMPFKEYCEDVSQQIDKILVQVPCKEKVVLLGQSTGADILRYLKGLGRISKAKATICSAPVVNGKVPNFVDRLFFGNRADYCNPHVSEGQEIIPILQRSIGNGVVLSSARDGFIPLESGFDYSGLNLVFEDFGHLAGVGSNRRFNRVYIEAIKSFVGS